MVEPKYCVGETVCVLGSYSQGPYACIHLDCTITEVIINHVMKYDEEGKYVEYSDIKYKLREMNNNLYVESQFHKNIQSLLRFHKNYKEEVRKRVEQ